MVLRVQTSYEGDYEEDEDIIEDTAQGRDNLVETNNPLDYKM